MTPVQRVTRGVIAEWGWQTGTTAEDRVCWLLSGMGVAPQTFEQQLRVGKYRIDFAVPAVKLALEVDGPRHQFDPECALKDAQRDAWLRRQGWMTIRVEHDLDDPTLSDHLVNVVRYLGSCCAVVRKDGGIGGAWRRKRERQAARERCHE